MSILKSVFRQGSSSSPSWSSVGSGLICLARLATVISFVSPILGIADESMSALSARQNAAQNIAADGYETLFPFYTTQCEFTQSKTIDGPKSSIMGHTLIYIKGACRDKSVNYPKLKMCDDPTAVNGVALSVDKILSNTQYIAVDGKDFLFNGNVPLSAPLDTAAIKSTVADVVASGSLNGIKIHESALRKKPVSLTLEEYIASVGVGTDFGVSFGRNATCVRIPMTETQVKAEVDYVNTSNEPYISGKKTFSWNAIGDNCANFTHDVLAAAGIGAPSARGNSAGRVLYDTVSFRFQIPTNAVLKDLELANDISQIRTASEIYQNATARATFDKLGTLPQLGAILENVPMHDVQNSVYKTESLGTFMMEIPVIDNRVKRIEDLSKNPDYVDAEENLRFVLERLHAVKTESASASSRANSSLLSSNPDYNAFAIRYNRWIDTAIADLESKLEKVSSLKWQTI